MTVPHYIRLELDPGSVAVSGGETIEALVTLQNTGTLVDVMTLAVVGVDEEFYELDSTEFRLFPGDEASAVLRFHPPRRPDVLSGEYPFNVTVGSRNNPDDEISTTGSLQVDPFYEFEAALSPEKITAATGTFTLSVKNQSNDSLSFAGSGSDAEGFCRYTFTPDPLTVAAGHEAESNVAVKTKRPLKGKPRTYNLSVTVTPDKTSDLQTVRAQLDAIALIRPWHIPVMVLTLIMLLVGAYSLFWWFAFSESWTFIGQEKWDDLGTHTIEYPLTHGIVYSIAFDLEGYPEKMEDEGGFTNKLSKAKKSVSDAAQNFDTAGRMARQAGVSTSAIDAKVVKVESAEGKSDHYAINSLGGAQSESDPSIRALLQWENHPDMASSITMILRSPYGKCSTPQRMGQGQEAHSYRPAEFPAMNLCNEVALSSILMNEDTQKPSSFEYAPPMSVYCMTKLTKKIIFNTEGIPSMDGGYNFDNAEEYFPDLVDPLDFENKWILYLVNHNHPEHEGPPANVQVRLKAVNSQNAKPLKQLFFYKGEKRDEAYEIVIDKVNSSGAESKDKDLLLKGTSSGDSCQPDWDQTDIPLAGIGGDGIEHGMIVGYQILGCSRVYWNSPGCEGNFGTYLQGLDKITVDATWDHKPSEDSTSSNPNTIALIIRDPYGNCWLRVIYQHEQPWNDTKEEIDLKTRLSCHETFSNHPEYLKLLINWEHLQPSTYFNTDPFVRFCKHLESGQSIFDSFTGRPIADRYTWIDDPDRLILKPGWFMYVINPENTEASPVVTLRIKGDRKTYKLKISETIDTLPFEASSLSETCQNQSVDKGLEAPELEPVVFVSRVTNDSGSLSVSEERTELDWDTGHATGFTWDRDGTRLAWTTNREGNGQIYMTTSDTVTDVTSDSKSKLVDGGNISLGVYNGDKAVKLSFNGANDFSPAWSPNGKSIAFVSDRTGDHDIYLLEVDTEELPTNLSEKIEWPDERAGSNEYDPTWADDGDRVFFTSYGGRDEDIWRVGVDGKGLTNLTEKHQPGNDKYASPSPGREYILFQSDREGNHDIFLMSSDGASPVNLTRSPHVNETNPKWIAEGPYFTFEIAPSAEGLPVTAMRRDIFVASPDFDAYLDLHKVPLRTLQPMTQSQGIDAYSAAVSLSGGYLLYGANVEIVEEDPAVSEVQETGTVEEDPAVSEVQEAGTVEEDPSKSEVQEAGTVEEDPAVSEVQEEGTVEEDPAVSEVQETGTVEEDPAVSEVQETGTIEEDPAVSEVQETGTIEEDPAVSEVQETESQSN